jgi:hypothetical protein
MMSRVVLGRGKRGWLAGRRERGRRGEEGVQGVLHQPLGALLAGERDFLSLALGEAVAAMRLDGARGIFVGGGREGGGGGAEGDEGSRWLRCAMNWLAGGLSGPSELLAASGWSSRRPRRPKLTSQGQRGACPRRRQHPVICACRSWLEGVEMCKSARRREVKRALPAAIRCWFVALISDRFSPPESTRASFAAEQMPRPLLVRVGPATRQLPQALGFAGVSPPEPPTRTSLEGE